MHTTTFISASLISACILAAGPATDLIAGETKTMRETASDKSVNRGKSTDEIFNGIMQTLPATEKTQVDSARGVSTASTVTRGDSGSHASRPVSAVETTRQAEREKALGQLSPELRRQVEQAIQDMKSSTEERRARMKESSSSPAR